MAMDVLVTANFHPFRMQLNKKNPVSMRLEVVNQSDTAKMLSVKTLVDRRLSFDKGGLTYEKVLRLENVPPGQTVVQYYDIHPKQMTRKGDHPVDVIVEEHYQNWAYVSNSLKMKFNLTVVE